MRAVACAAFNVRATQRRPEKLPLIVQVSVVAANVVGVAPTIKVKATLLPLPTFAEIVALRLLIVPLVVTLCAQVAIFVDGVHGRQ